MWLFRLEVRRHISSALEFQLQLQSEKGRMGGSKNLPNNSADRNSLLCLVVTVDSPSMSTGRLHHSVHWGCEHPLHCGILQTQHHYYEAIQLVISKQQRAVTNRSLVFMRTQYWSYTKKCFLCFLRNLFVCFLLQQLFQSIPHLSSCRVFSIFWIN